MDLKLFISLLIVFSYSVIPVMGQNMPDSGFTDKREARNKMVNRVKEGKWVEYWKNAYNTPARDTNAPYYTLTIYKSGVPFGIKRCYHRNRKLEWEVLYMNGKRNGMLKEFYENGKLEYEAPYTNDRIDGIARQFYQTGLVDIEMPYTHDTLDGKQTEYFENGNIMREIFYTKGKQGETRMYGENGIEIK
jgi:antitoxin component YwqK of YwqJK toxin-antitoxin module